MRGERGYGMKLTLARIAELVSAAGEFPAEEVAQGYSIDSRSVGPGQLFFAVKGERLDGHDFAESARERGAVAAVVRRDQLGRYPRQMRLLAVEDTLVALQTLAMAVRKLWAKPVIAVTGSMGKTTTKEAIAHVLSTRFRVLKSEGNFNNHFGLPLMLLKVAPDYDVAVVEMGMSHAGEIRALAKIAQPEMGVVTNVAPVHLEFFDSVAGIARAKYELIESLPAGGTAVLNADDEYVAQFGRDFKGKVVMYGTRAIADVRAENVRNRGAEGSEFDVVIGGVREPARLPLVGEHNVVNALAAVAVGLERGLKRWQVWLRRINAERFYDWATSRSSTIVTIAIRKRSRRWWMHWRRWRSGVASPWWARCLSLVGRKSSCTGRRASILRRRRSTCCWVCADRRRRWSKQRSRRGCGRSLCLRRKKPVSGWRVRRATATRCC